MNVRRAARPSTVTKRADRPRDELIPKRHEWLPKAFSREVAQLAPEARERARERVRRALADGVIKAILQTDWGQVEEIAQRMWRKADLECKVYPRFVDGRMRMRERPYDGDYPEGWIYVPEGSLRQLLSSARATAGAVTKTRKWLETLMREKGGPNKTKPEYRKEAKDEFGVGTKGFRTAWKEATKEVGNKDWGRPGRPKQRRAQIN